MSTQTKCGPQCKMIKGHYSWSNKKCLTTPTLPKVNLTTSTHADNQALEPSENAIQIIEKIKERYPYDTADGMYITILRDEWSGGEIISWEEGPDNWAQQFLMGGSTEEERALAAQASKEFGTQIEASEKSPVELSEEITELLDVQNSYSLVISPA